MKAPKILLYFFCWFVFFQLSSTTLKIIPQYPKVTYVNPKYLNYMNISVRKLNRHVGVVMNADFELVYSTGNNATIGMVLMENLSGRYQPTAVQFKYKLCDWLNKEPILGQKWAKIAAVKCPLPKGRIQIKNATLNLDDFQYIIPFTWANYVVLTRMDVNLNQTETNEHILAFSMHFSMVQKSKKI